MIQGLSAGYGIHINNGYNSAPYVDQSRYDAGRLRMIGNTLEVYTGSSWCPVTNGTTHVELSAEVVELLEWAKQKRADDEKIKALAAKYPAISTLQSQLDMMICLVKDYDAEQEQEP
jgi:hypothetical protein